MRRIAAYGCVVGLLAGLLAAPASAQEPVDPATELQNYNVGRERLLAWSPLLPGVLDASAAFQQDRRAEFAADPERAPDPNACTTVVLCPVDPRLDGWEDRGGIVKPVL